MVGLSETVVYLRERRGLSARALSRLAGVSPSYVSKLEAGEIEPSVKIFASLALALGMSSSEIVYCVASEAARSSAQDPLSSADE